METITDQELNFFCCVPKNSRQMLPRETGMKMVNLNLTERFSKEVDTGQVVVMAEAVEVRKQLAQTGHSAAVEGRQGQMVV